MRKKVGSWNIVLSLERVTVARYTPRDKLNIIFTFDFSHRRPAEDLYNKITSVKSLRKVVSEYNPKRDAFFR